MGLGGLVALKCPTPPRQWQVQQRYLNTVSIRSPNSWGFFFFLLMHTKLVFPGVIYESDLWWVRVSSNKTVTEWFTRRKTDLKLRMFRKALQPGRQRCFTTAHSPQASGFLSSFVSLNISVLDLGSRRPGLNGRAWEFKGIAWPKQKQRELRLLGFVGSLQQRRCL